MVAGAVSASGLEARFTLRLSDHFEIDIALSAPPGTTIALLGPNGAGKSTVVAAIAGLLAVDTGTIRLGEQVFDDPSDGVFVPPERRNVGVVFQDYLLFNHMTVLDNVAFGSRSRGVSRSVADERARTWVSRLGLDGLDQERPEQLSGGQAQRVALARALATEPGMVLLDEPLAALDVTTRSSLRHLLHDHLRSFDGPRLLITHDPAEASLLADVIYIVEDGKVTQSGSADEIRLHPRSAYAADLGGSNLLSGVATGDVVEVDGHPIHLADAVEHGPVLVMIPANAISIHTSQPSGSPRNTWETRVERVEPMGTRVRLVTGLPLHLTVEVTREAREELRLEPGSRVWVAVKATETSVLPDND